MKSLILACLDSQNGIGKNNSIPWKIPEDLSWFKRMTKQSYIIIGRKTWESLPRKVKEDPQRTILVISKSLDIPNAFPSIPDAHGWIFNDKKWTTIVYAGGNQIYREAMNKRYAQYLYLTTIDKFYDCDVFYPNIPIHYALENVEKKTYGKINMFILKA